MDTPIATARTVHLVQRDTDNKFYFVYDDDGTDMPYVTGFPSKEVAEAWLFTPLVLNPTVAPEKP